MPDSTNPVAICPVCLNPLADQPAVLREGDAYVHLNCWSGREPAERATLKPEEVAADQKPEPGQAA